MTNYHAPETALLDLDWLLDQAGLLITSNSIDCELEARMDDYHKVSGCSGSSAREFLPSAPAATGIRRGDSAQDVLRVEIRRFLACESVEEIYDPYLDRTAKLELACRKAEVSRLLDRLVVEVCTQVARKAA